MNKIFGIFALVAFLAAPVSALGATYEIDGSHTKVGFKIKHLGISNVDGRFKAFEGTFDFDPKNIAASKTSVKISVASIDTGNEKRDDHLRNPDFFNAPKFPAMTFESKSIKNIKGKKFTIVGDLTMAGVKNPVELDVTFEGAATDPWGNERVAFTATTELNRKDYGLKWNKMLETGGLVVGEMVKVAIEIQGIKKK